MIDASIPLGVHPVQIEPPINQLAKVLQVQGSMRDNQLGQLKMDEYQRGNDEMNALRNVMGQSGFSWDDPTQRNAAFAAAPLRAEPIYKAHTEGLTAKATFDEKTFKVAKERHDIFQSTIGALANEPNLTKDMVTQAGQSLVQQGILPEAMYTQAVASMPDDPAQLRARLLQGQKARMSPTEIFTIFAPKPEKVGNGQTFGFRDLNPNSPTYGQPTGGAEVQMVPNPEAVLQSDTSTANNKRTVGAAYDNANATRAVAQATRDAAAIQSNQNTEMKLGDDYRAQSKNFKETADAYKQITSVLDKATTSPAATLAGATKFMKMIDPGSVVRESELGMALAATGVFDRASNYFNTLRSGKVLTASQVQDFKAITKQINDAASQQQKLIDNHFSSVAKQYGLRPEMVVQDFGQNTPAPSGDVPSDIAAILQKHGGERKGK